MTPFFDLPYDEKLRVLAQLQNTIHDLVGDDMGIVMFLINPNGCVDTLTSKKDDRKLTLAEFDALVYQMNALAITWKNTQVSKQQNITKTPYFDDSYLSKCMDEIWEKVMEYEKRDDSFFILPNEIDFPRLNTYPKIVPISVIPVFKRLVFVRNKTKVPVGLN